MVQQLIAWLPDQIGAVAVFIAIAGALVGAVLWLAGARFSPMLVGLVTVSIGAAVGMAMPRYFGWTVSGAGPAVAMALLLGFSGFIMHRIWIGVGLGTVLAAWAALTTWVSLYSEHTFVWPAFRADGNAIAYFTTLWHMLPADIASTLPYVCGTAMLAGLVITIIWPRLAVATAWSLAGVSLLVAMGSAAMEFGRPQWISSIPKEPGAQLLGLLALVAVGAGVQWKTGRLSGAPATSPYSGESATAVFSRYLPREVTP